MTRLTILQLNDLHDTPNRITRSGMAPMELPCSRR
jgi:hypothetical protein